MKILRWALGIVVLAAVVIVGGTYLYIHVIEGPAPKKLGLPSTTSGSAAPVSTDSLVGTWKATSGSEAGYRVDEILFGQNNTAVGRTTDVTGTMVIAGGSVTSTRLTVDLTSMKSDQSRRDAQFRGRIMDVDQFPTATFELTQPIVLRVPATTGVDVDAQATGRLTLRGQTRAVTVALQARDTGSQIQVSGSIPIEFAEWGIPNPSLGPITTEDHGTIEFLVRFARA